MPMPGYELPDDGCFRTINLSGGRSSAMMAMRIQAANGGEIPAERAAVVFCNTGLEREETYAFVRDIEERAGMEVHWLEFRHRESPGEGEWVYDVERVGFETASRAGEPFSQLNRAARILPNAVMRKCTAELKVMTAQRYVSRVLGRPKERVRNVLGIRHDEPARWRRHLMNPAGCTSDYPLVVQRVARADVDAFWARQNFDLGIPSELSNCTLCFLKGRRHLLSVIRAEPHLADWWINEERLIAKDAAGRAMRGPETARFSSRHSYSELKRIATQSEDLFAEAFAQGGGEGEQEMDCLCTD